MSTDPFVAEIMIFAGDFAPNGWAFCDGHQLPISQNTALFALLGTTYGGNGITTFALPDLRDRGALHSGQAPGLSQRDLGETGGAATVTLNVNQLPAHTHPVQGVDGPGDGILPVNRAFAVESTDTITPYRAGPANASMASSAISQTGGGQPHNNLPPYLTLNYIIALQGIFPPRN